MARTVEEIQVLLKARDEATIQLKKVKKDLRTLDRQITGAGTVWKKYQRQIAAGGAAIAAITGKMGKDWQDSRRSIVDATGASGKALDGLMASYRGVQGTVAASNAEIAKAVGDLNTHTKRSGAGLENLATKALKAGLNTDILGKSIKSFNVVGAEQERLVDKLVTLGQSYGANLTQLQTDVGRYKGDLDALGLSMDQQITLAALAQSENQKLRNVVRELEDGTGGWREKLNQALPALDNVAGATERAYQDGKTFGQTLTELRGRLEGMVGALSQVAAGAGGLVSGFAAAATAFPGMAGQISGALKVVTTTSRTMWLSLTGVGLLAAAGAALWGFRDKVASLLASLLKWSETASTGYSP